MLRASLDNIDTKPSETTREIKSSWILLICWQFHPWQLNLELRLKTIHGYLVLIWTLSKCLAPCRTKTTTELMTTPNRMHVEQQRHQTQLTMETEIIGLWSFLRNTWSKHLQRLLSIFSFILASLTLPSPEDTFNQKVKIIKWKIL